MTTTVAAAPFSAMGMYPAQPLRAAWDRLYAAAAAEIADAPAALCWDLDPADTWLDPGLVLGMTCGWPLITTLQHRVRVVGTFAYDLGGAASPAYRSVIIARVEAPLEDFNERSVAANSSGSLSGWISLLAAFDRGGATWPGAVTWTGSHLASIDAVRGGLADIASIDAVTWAHRQRDAPQTLEGLVVVGRGPLVPCLPIVIGGATSDEQLEAWRTAFRGAIEDPSVADARDTLLIAGFAPLDFADYEIALADLLVYRTTP